MRSILSLQRDNKLAKLTINIILLFLSYMMINYINDIYHLKKTLALYFIISLISYLITSNNITRTKIYLAVSAIGLGLIQVTDYSYFLNLLDKEFCFIIALSSITSTGPFRLTRSVNCEKFLSFMSIISPFLVFYILKSTINNFEVIILYSILSAASTIFISIMREEKITPSSLAEIYSIYLLVLHSKHLIPVERTLEYLIFFLFMSLSFSYLKDSHFEEKYKKTMNYVMAMLPFSVNIAPFEYITSSIIFFNLVLSPYFYSFKDVITLDMVFLEQAYLKTINYNPFENFRFEIKDFPSLKLSVSFTIFFIFIFLFLYIKS